MSMEAPWSEPPWLGLHARLLEHIQALEAEGRSETAAELRAVVAGWWEEQETWRLRLFELLRLHHDLNNALVGIRGNAQLMLMGTAVQTPGVKDRLEVMLRETSRIQEAAGRIRELKSTLGSAAPIDRVA